MVSQGKPHLTSSLRQGTLPCSHHPLAFPHQFTHLVGSRAPDCLMLLSKSKTELKNKGTKSVLLRPSISGPF